MAQEQVQGREARRTMRDYAVASLQEYQTSIRRSAIRADNFEIDPVIIQIIHTSVMFGGLPSEDPLAHINNFLEICDTLKQKHVTDDAFRLRLFPLSLKDRAKAWLQSFPADYFTTWDDLAQKFFSKYFPPAKTAKLRQEIVTFTQFESEPLHEAWDRFKELLGRCPHHGLPKWLELQTFYDGLTGPTRAHVDIAAGGALMGKYAEEAYELLEEMAAQDILNVQRQDLEDRNPFVTCNFCGGGHIIDQCPHQMESTSYVGGSSWNNAFSNTHNSDWRNHPNISYGNEQAVASMAISTPAFTQQQHKPLHDRFDSLEETMHLYMARTYSLLQNQTTILRAQAASLRALESRVGQLTRAINSRTCGAFWSVAETNPRGKGIEQVQAIRLKCEAQQVDEVEPENSQLQTTLNKFNWDT